MDNFSTFIHFDFSSFPCLPVPGINYVGKLCNKTNDSKLREEEKKKKIFTLKITSHVVCMLHNDNLLGFYGKNSVK